jgi:3-hydroxyacyl-CoA dehydrogenase
MSLLDGMMENKKKFYIQLGIIGACLIGAVVAYVVMSSDSATVTPADQAAQQRVEEITAPMMDAASKTPAPEIQRSPTRGRIPYQTGQ